jgi:hypothetical protein
MKSFFYLVIFVVIAFVSCTPRNEPKAFICPESPLVIFIDDTLELNNCSKNYTRQRWDMPNGAVSTQDKIKFTSDVDGTFVVKLTIGNDDWANDYVTKTTIIVKEF